MGARKDGPIWQALAARRPLWRKRGLIKTTNICGGSTLAHNLKYMQLEFTNLPAARRHKRPPRGLRSEMRAHPPSPPFTPSASIRTSTPPARAGGRRAVCASGVFHIMPERGLKPLEELFRAQVITFLVDGHCREAAAARLVHCSSTRRMSSERTSSRHLRALARGVRPCSSGTDPPPRRNDPRSVARHPFPDYDTEPVVAFSAT